jgi:hypothetical protein
MMAGPSAKRSLERALAKAGVVIIDPDDTHGPGVMLRQAKRD